MVDTTPAAPATPAATNDPAPTKTGAKRTRSGRFAPAAPAEPVREASEEVVLTPGVASNYEDDAPIAHDPTVAETLTRRPRNVEGAPPLSLTNPPCARYGPHLFEETYKHSALPVGDGES